MKVTANGQRMISTSPCVCPRHQGGVHMEKKQSSKTTSIFSHGCRYSMHKTLFILTMREEFNLERMSCETKKVRN